MIPSIHALLYALDVWIRNRRDDDDTPEPVEHADSSEPVAPPSRKPATPKIPTGKGMFVRHLRAHCGSPDQMAELCVRTGIKWVAIMAAWQNNRVKWYNGNIEDYARSLRTVDVDVWVWGYPKANIHPSFVDALKDRALAAEACGIILDPEKPWIGSHGIIAKELVDHIRSMTQLPVGFTSYGWPRNFKSFPWKAFAEVSDFAIPQAYDSRDNMGPKYQRQSVEAYRRLGFKNIIPGLRTYNIDPPKISEIYRRTPTPSDAVIWWDWFNTGQREWDVIASLAQPGEELAA